MTRRLFIQATVQRTRLSETVETIPEPPQTIFYFSQDGVWFWEDGQWRKMAEDNLTWQEKVKRRMWELLGELKN